jgi:hypothetical protein
MFPGGNVTRLGLAISIGGLALALGCQPPAAEVRPIALGRAVSFRSEVVPVLQEHCAGCHSLGRQAASVPMFDSRGAPIHRAIKTHFFHMLLAIEEGTMPRGKPGSVPADKVGLLKAWWEAGAPDN